jgi:hypothetical protein
MESRDSCAVYEWRNTQKQIHLITVEKKVIKTEHDLPVISCWVVVSKLSDGLASRDGGFGAIKVFDVIGFFARPVDKFAVETEVVLFRGKVFVGFNQEISRVV